MLLTPHVSSNTGTYIRTNDGRIFAIRSGKISRPVVGGSAASRGTNSYIKASSSIVLPYSHPNSSCDFVGGLFVSLNLSSLYFSVPSTDTQGSLIHSVSNGCSSPFDMQQRSPNEEQCSSPLSAEILRELSRYTSSTGDEATGMGNELPSPPDASAVPAGDGDDSQNSPTGDLGRQRSDNLMSSALELRGTKRKSTESPGSTQLGGKRTSSAARFPGLSMGSSGLSFPPMGLNSSSLLGNLGHMSHPLLMGGSGGSSFLQTPGQTLADLQTMFPSAGSDLLRQSAPGNGHLPTPSSSSLSTVYSSASTTVPMSSTPSAATSSSMASGSLPPYMMNPSMAGLLSSGLPPQLQSVAAVRAEDVPHLSSFWVGGVPCA